VIYAVPCDFTHAEFAAVGKYVWACTVLEHELARAAMWLRFKNAEAGTNPPIDDAIIRAVKGTMRGRFKEFTSAYEAGTSTEPGDSWIETVRKRFLEIAELRDRVTHGIWKRGDDGGIAKKFHDRVSTEQEIEVLYQPLPLSRVEELTDQSLILAIEVARVSGAVMADQ